MFKFLAQKIFGSPAEQDQRPRRHALTIGPSEHPTAIQPLSVSAPAPYKTVLPTAVQRQGFAAVDRKAQQISKGPNDTRASFLDNDANDPNGPGAQYPAARFKILEVVDRHQEVLVRKFKQVVIEDDYGTYNFDAWNKEADYFIDRVLKRELDWDLMGLPDQVPRSIVSHRVVAWRVAPNTTSDVGKFDPGMSGQGYENFCADLLRTVGWQTKVTKATGDQGVDIEATKNGRRVVFQCKKYSSAVGNAAVQEILAGKAFYCADVGAVVSNAGFTPSANQLAKSTGIHLLHHDDLLTFEA